MDDAIISTDVDNLVKILSREKRLELSDLARKSGLPRHDVEKWLKILEEEGYIRLEYNLTRIIAIWSGIEGESNLSYEEEREETPVKKTEEYKYSETEEKKPSYEEETDEITFKPSDFEDSEKEIPYEYSEEDSESLKESEEIVDDIVEKNVPESEYESGEKEEINLEEPLDTIEELKLEEQFPIEKPKSKKTQKISKIISKYLEEISAQKEELRKLKLQKQALYKERILPLESKMGSDITLFMELLLKKEQKIIELKERALQIPERMGELDELNRTVEKIDVEVSSVLSEAKKKLDSLLENTKSSKDKLASEIEKTMEMTEAEKSRAALLSEDLKKIEFIYEEIKHNIQNAESKIRDLNHHMSSLKLSLDDVSEARMDLREQIEDIERIAVRREQQLTSLTEEFSEIERLENEIRQYVKTYDEKIAEIKNYLVMGDEELSELKKSANAHHIKKYLRDLEDLVNEYDTELKDAIELDQSIEEKMDAAKKRLNTLISESKDAIKGMYHRAEEHEDFEEVSGRVKGIQFKVLDSLERKSEERMDADLKISSIKSGRTSKRKKVRKKPSSKTNGNGKKNGKNGNGKKSKKNGKKTKKR